MDAKADQNGLFCSHGLRKRDIGLYAAFTLLIIGGLVCLAYVLIDDPDLKFGAIKFSMEPIVHTGFHVVDFEAGAATPPAFNVTLHARNTHKHRYCGRSTTVRVAYADVVVAIARMDPFCVEPKETSVLTGSASPGWPVLPLQFRERVRRDTGGGGGAEMEVDVKFYNDLQGSMWVRCLTVLDAKEASRCKLLRFF